MGPFTLLNPTILKRIKALEGKLSDLEKKMSILQKSSFLTWEAEKIDYYRQQDDFSYLYSINPIRVLHIDGNNRKFKILDNDGNLLEEYSWENISNVQNAQNVVAITKYNGNLYALMSDGKLLEIFNGEVREIATFSDTYYTSYMKVENENMIIFSRYQKIIYNLNTKETTIEGLPFQVHHYVNNKFSMYIPAADSSFGGNSFTMIHMMDINTQKIRVVRVLQGLEYATFNNEDEGYICFSHVSFGSTNKVVRKEKMDEFLDLVWEL